MKRIGEILIYLGYVTEEEVNKALSDQKESHLKIGEIFIKKNVITDEMLADALSKQMNIQYIDIEGREISSKLLNLFVSTYMRKNRFLPVEINKRELLLATDNPMNPDLISESGFITGFDISLAVVTSKQLNKKLDEIFGHEAANLNRDFDIMQISEDNEELNIEAADKEINTKPVVRLVNAIILDAIKLRASDIHFEPQDNSFLVRYRIDGFLTEHLRLPKKTEKMIVSRIKIMAKMDITVNRKAQDGKIQLYVANKDINLRISTLPIMNGEKVVIRILDKSKIQVKLHQLGISYENEKMIIEDSKKAQGIILVTGPTGSGKTTTLYSILQELDINHINVSTIEDPIEYTIKGINQTQIDTKGGMTFATALRTLLRQDPNVILVGEIRDSETASTAFKAAMTGHLILSTVHTNDEVSTIVRLKDLGVDTFLISDALLVVIAQRLVRKVCADCAIEHETDSEEMHILHIDKPIKVLQANENGCESCGFTGYKGVIGIYGVLKIDSELRVLIEKGATVRDIGNHLIKIGYKNVYEDGIDKVMNRITTIEEMKRVLDINRFHIKESITFDDEERPKNNAIRILIVDDTKTLRTMLNALLTGEGYDVKETENGKEALEELKRKKYDMVISDVSMPEMDGFELLENIRNDKKLFDLPVVMLTSKTDGEFEIKGLKNGADDYISKPIDPEKIILRIKNIVKRVRRSDEADS